jgi:hypothetical protein
MLDNAIRLTAAFGNPFERTPPSNGEGSPLPAELREKVKDFWASQENYTVHALPRDPKIPLDLTLEIRVPDGRLLNGQAYDFITKYVMPYGPRLGRWYFTRKVLSECRRGLRNLAILGGAAAALRAISRWLGGHG